MRQPKKESAAGMRLDYMMAAAWYYYRAEGADEQLASALNRMQAQKLHQRFLGLGMELPTPEEIQGYAQSKWPAHKLHEVKP